MSKDLHERIAEALGWTESECRSFSLATLREFVRAKDPGLATEITEILDEGRHIAVAAPPRKRPR